MSFRGAGNCATSHDGAAPARQPDPALQRALPQITAAEAEPAVLGDTAGLLAAGPLAEVDVDGVLSGAVGLLEGAVGLGEAGTVGLGESEGLGVGLGDECVGGGVGVGDVLPVPPPVLPPAVPPVLPSADSEGVGSSGVPIFPSGPGSVGLGRLVGSLTPPVPPPDPPDPLDDPPEPPGAPTPDSPPSSPVLAEGPTSREGPSAPLSEVAPSPTTVPSTATSSAPAPAATRFRRAIPRRLRRCCAPTGAAGGTTTRCF